MIDITTIKVVVAITTPRRVRKERSLCARKASRAIQKASRAVPQTPELALDRAVSAWGTEVAWPMDAKDSPASYFGSPIGGGEEGGCAPFLTGFSMIRFPSTHKVLLTGA
jgi:hypothetical protein